MKANKDIQQHFSIRKLSVGAASVLIGISFLGYGAQTVHADTTGGSAAQSVIETKAASSNSPVAKQVTQPAKQVAPVAKSSNDTAVTAAPKAGDTTLIKPAAKSEANTPKIVASESKASTDTKKNAVTTVKKAEVQKQVPVKKTADEKGKTKTLEVGKTSKAVPKDLAAQKREEVPAWNLNDWDNTVSGGNMTLTNYKGHDADVYIPNAADLKEKDPTSTINQVYINRCTIDSLRNKATTSNVTVSHKGDQKVIFDGNNLASAFANANNLHHLDLACLDVSGVQNMGHLFANDSSLQSVDVTGWNTSRVHWMDNMFLHDSELTTIAGIGGWDTSSVETISHMFDCVVAKPYSSEPGSFTYPEPAGKLTQLNLSNWDTSHVNNMEGVFWGQKELTSVGDFTNWKTDHVTTMRAMFEYCTKLTFSDQAISHMSHWNTGNVTTMRETFDGLASQADLSCVQNWDTHNVTDMSYMFDGDKNLTNVGDLTHRGNIWDTSKVGSETTLSNGAETQNYGMSLMFRDCEKLPEIKGIGTWDVSHVTKMRQMFYNTKSLKAIALRGWTTRNLKIAGELFAYSGVQNVDMSGLDLSNLAHFSGSGMLTYADQSHRGVEYMFAHLQRPAVINLDNTQLPNDDLKFLIDDFVGDQPIVVFSNNSDVNNLNEAHWTDSNNKAVTGRQNSDYLTIYQGTTTTKVPMNFVYKDQAALASYLAEKLAPFGNMPRTGSRVGANAAAALQDVTGIYGTPSNPDIPDPGDDNHHEQPGNNDKPEKPTIDDDKPGKPNIDDDQPTQPNINEDKPERPNIDDETPQIPHLAGDQGQQNGQHGQQVANKTAQAAVTKQAANKLPQTGDKKASLAWLGLGLASMKKQRASSVSSKPVNNSIT